MTEPVNSLMAARLDAEQRRRLGNALLARQFDRPTPQDTAVTDRASLFPLGTYGNGQTGIAWPGIIAQPVEKMAGVLRGEITPGTPEFNEAGFDIAGAAMVGGLAAGRPRGSLGMSGRPTNSLDMTDAARMQRAREMGFDTNRTWYHGTSTPGIKQLEPGRRDPGIWVTTDINNAANYAKGFEPEVHYLRVAPKKTFTVENISDDAFVPAHNGAALPFDNNVDIVKHAFRNGYDSVNFPGGNFTESGNTMVLSHGNQLRDVDAAFDPAKADSANLLYANGGRPGAALGAGLSGASERQGIRAYHGSPHDFDRFDMSRIGTGEGAQAYGHGLYFAEAEAVAKQYRDSVGKPSMLTSQSQSMAARLLSTFGGDYDTAIRIIRQQGDEATALALEDMKAKGVKAAPPGRLYEVRINADPSDFLDWDKPLSQQSEKVRGAVEKLLPEISSDAAWGDIYAGLRNAEQSRLYDEAKRKGLGFAETGRLLSGQDKAVTSRLNGSGIPGIKYLDQGSRSTGEGSRNYVVFDENLIEILRKYGLLGMLGAGGMAHELMKPASPKIPDDAA